MKNSHPDYNHQLQQTQYGSAANLNARIKIHRLYTQYRQTWNDFVFDCMAVKPGEAVLEIGAGTASQTRQNRDRFPSEISYSVTDFSLGMLDEAIPDLKPDKRFQFAILDAQALPFENESFDLVTANHMLYHVPEISLALQEIYRVLKHGGRMMATTNGKDHLLDLDLLIAEFTNNSETMHHFHASFTLENGGPKIQEVFRNVRMIPYASSLWVTNAKDLTDYAFSMAGINDCLNGHQPDELNAYFQAIINSKGGIAIRKSSGAFLASKA